MVFDLYSACRLLWDYRTGSQRSGGARYFKRNGLIFRLLNTIHVIELLAESRKLTPNKPKEETSRGRRGHMDGNVQSETDFVTRTAPVSRIKCTLISNLF